MQKDKDTAVADVKAARHSPPRVTISCLNLSLSRASTCHYLTQLNPLNSLSSRFVSCAQKGNLGVLKQVLASRSSDAEVNKEDL